MRIGINGFGRIGRAFLRSGLRGKGMDIVCLNDVNPDTNNVAYLLKYDSTYGRFEGTVATDEQGLVINGKAMPVHHEPCIENVPWERYGVDIVIDASGVRRNIEGSLTLRERGVKHCIFTNSPETPLPLHYVVFGVNHEALTQDDFLISSSICDSNAFVPVMNLLHEAFGVESGFVTTLHPWLNYQNLLDGPALSVSDPGSIHSTYVLGRASVGVLIPKTTTVLAASRKILPWLDDNFMCMSYRIPTNIVSTADISIKLRSDVTTADVAELFFDAQRRQRHTIFDNNCEALTSIDFLQREASVTVDHRWIMVSGKNYLKLVLWYDNEWGYASRVVDIVRWLETLHS